MPSTVSELSYQGAVSKARMPYLCVVECSSTCYYSDVVPFEFMFFVLRGVVGVDKAYRRASRMVRSGTSVDRVLSLV